MRRLLTSLAIGGLSMASVLTPAAAAGQERASIVGVVQDASGGIMPGVTVEASSPRSSNRRAARSPTARGATRSSTCGPAPTR
jgi:hypothetical protein